ncbi:MAG: nitrous oxide reductase accessory protein NosL [Flavobacteriales bacterium]|nr:nitrous oxide reductase accessory protein NosL [Flavobacteriales bacterium]
MRRILTHLIPLLVLVLVVSCGPKQPSIAYGKAECAHCRMNVVDQRFAAALITRSGRQYVFDGIECMVPFVAKGTVAEGQVEAWYVCDHAHPGILLDATAAHYLHGPAFRSPMRGDVAAFATTDDRDAARTRDGGEPLDWAAARKLLTE